MKAYMDEHFLLDTATARQLYHEQASRWPICDFHCHINPSELAANQSYANLSDVWLGGDHYKWRAMRLAGVPERLITGTADPEEKFMAWAGIMPQLIGNPLHHWTHLELQRYFGIGDTLSHQTAPSIWQRANDALARPEFRPLQMLERMNVRWLCTTDDPADSLESHRVLGQTQTAVTVIPAFRPDRFFKLAQSGFSDALQQLEARINHPLRGFDDLAAGLVEQVDRFTAHGCRLADHGFDTLPEQKPDLKKAERALRSRLAGQTVDPDDLSCYQAALLYELAEAYQKNGWTMQLHVGALRNASQRQFSRMGADTGYDVIRDIPIAENLVLLLDTLEQAGRLPRTLLYSLNAQDNLTLAVIAGAFARDGEPAWVRPGPAWWFHDQLDGIRQHLKHYSQVGVLSTYIGMTTDSRSLLSYTRHEYFRRIFCQLLGSWVENGLYPADMDALQDLIGRVCYQNAASLFGENRSVID